MSFRNVMIATVLLLWGCAPEKRLPEVCACDPREPFGQITIADRGVWQYDRALASKCDPYLKAGTVFSPELCEGDSR